MARITIPYAVADFVEMRERNFYYVDKTDFIPGLEDYKGSVFLRPRRFGKKPVYLYLGFVTTTVPRPTGSRNCSAGLGSGSTRRRSIIVI